MRIKLRGRWSGSVVGFSRTGGLALFLALLLAFSPAVWAQRGVESSRPMPKTEAELAFEAMELRVQTVFDRIAAVVEPRHPELAEYTIQPVTEKVPNAWINQDNEIYVTSGLLELLKEDDQLAGVIGHEIAHGTQGHIPHRIHQSLWSAFAVVALGAVAGGQGSSDWGGLLHMRDLFMYAFSREQESEADLVGMRYARDAGYRSEGLVEALKLMDDERQRLPEDSVWQQLYRSHPPIPNRVMDLRLILAAESLQQAQARNSGTGGLGAGGVGGSRNTGANSPEEAALGFTRALLGGDESALRLYVLPGRAGDMLARASTDGTGGGAVDDAAANLWSKAELEVVDRTESPFSTQLTVRLWRPSRAGETGAEVSSPAFTLAMQRSARGWVVVDWSAGQ